MSSTPGTGFHPDHASGQARALWEARHATLAVERDRWRICAFAALALAGVAIVLAVWAAVSSRYVPHIVTVDSFNRPAAALAPQSVTDWPDAVVRHEIAAFISDWRAVSLDGAVMRGRLNRIAHFYETGTPAHAKLVTWAAENDPFRRAERETVDVEVVSINAAGGDTWIVEWVETARKRGTGRVETTRRFTATVTLRQRKVRDFAVLLKNPLGMAVVDFDLQQIQ